MPQLRFPRTDLAYTVQGAAERADPNRLTGGQVCTDCAWNTWCLRYGCCWKLEKADIEKEKRADPKPVWTRETIVEAIRAWNTCHGALPTTTDWQRTGPGRPTAHVVQRRFGTWNHAIRAAGFRPRRSPWVD